MIRNSSLPMFLDCPSSAAPGAWDYRPESDAAEDGDVVHAELAAHVENKPPTRRLLTEEQERLVSYGLRAWSQILDQFPLARAEVRLENGTADVLSVVHDGPGYIHSLGVLDWKSGRVRRQPRAQVMGYARDAVAKFGWPATGYVTTAVVWLRFGEIDVKNVYPADIEAFTKEIAEKEKRIGRDYAPGECCTFCPRQLQCPARREMIAQAGTAIVGRVSDSELTADVLANLYPKAKVLRRALDEYDKQLRASLQVAPIPTTDGRELRLADVVRKDIDARKAWPVLERAGFTEDEISGALSVSNEEVSRVVKSKAAPRRKGADVAALWDALRDAGAITETTHQKIEEGPQRKPEEK